MSQEGFSFRSFVSVTVLLLFLLCVISGAALYIKPQGKVASWQFWQIVGLGKTGWESLHTISCFSFLLLATIHLILNWSNILKYIGRALGSGVAHLMELVLALVVVAAVICSSLFSLPPLQMVMELGEGATDSWTQGSGAKPPFEKAERSTLSRFCAEVSLELEQAVARLREAGIRIESAEQSLEEIAEANGTTPRNLYLMMQ